MPRLGAPRLSWVLAGSLLLTAGGFYLVASEDRCPTQEEADEMSYEELNKLSRKCNGPQPPAADAPGVTVSNDADDQDGRPTTAAKELFGPPGEVLRDKIDEAADVDFFGLQWPGGAIRVMVTPPASGARVAVTDLDGDAQLGSFGDEAVSDLKGTLSAGRYLVRVFSAREAATPFQYYVESRRG